LAAKPVITATQMLESMIKAPVPTRAEVSDVANAILDGTDAIMLSEETTLGDYPVESVVAMTRIAKRIENDLLHEQLLSSTERVDAKNISESVAASAVKTAQRIGAKYLVSLTNSGYGARLLSRHRSQYPILTFTPDKVTYQKSILNLGNWMFDMKKYTDFKHAVKDIKDAIAKNKLAKKGDKIVIVGSRPFGKAVQSNMMVVEEI